MKEKNLKSFYDDITETLYNFELEYQEQFDFNEGSIREKTHDNIVVYLRALQLIIEKKMKKRGKKQ